MLKNMKMTQTRILFICHGNICRSAAAEMVMRELLRREGAAGREIAVSSAAVSAEEIGNDVYPPMRAALARAGIPCLAHAARQVTRGDYDRFDRIVCMDGENLRGLHRLFRGDPDGKVSLLLDWAGEPGGEIPDPWYTRDFDGALRSVVRGCEGLLADLHARL